MPRNNFLNNTVLRDQLMADKAKPRAILRYYEKNAKTLWLQVFVESIFGKPNDTLTCGSD